MDVVPDFTSLGLGAGVFVIFGYVVIHTMKLASGDRTNYQAMETNLRKQHSLEIEALNTQHQAELQDCRHQRDKIQTDLEETRDKLWKARETAAHRRRRVAGGEAE